MVRQNISTAIINLLVIIHLELYWFLLLSTDISPSNMKIDAIPVF